MKKIAAFILAAAILTTGCNADGKATGKDLSTDCNTKASTDGKTDASPILESDIEIPEDKPVLMIISSNMAWGFQYDGTLIAGNGDVYLFNNPIFFTNEAPDASADAIRTQFENLRDFTKPAGTVDVDYLKEIYAQAVNIDPDAELKRRAVGNDMGQRTNYFIDGDLRPIEINSKGDNEEYLDDDHAMEVKDLLEEMGGHIHITDKEPYAIYQDPISIDLSKMPETKDRYLCVDNYKDLHAALRELGCSDAPFYVRDKMLYGKHNNLRAYIRIEEGPVTARGVMVHDNTLDFLIEKDKGNSQASLFVTIQKADRDYVSADGSKWTSYTPTRTTEDDNEIYQDFAATVFAMTAKDRNGRNPGNILFAPLGLYKELLLLRDCQTGEFKEQLENAIGDMPAVKDESLMHGYAMIECGDYPALELPDGTVFDGTRLDNSDPLTQIDFLGMATNNLISNCGLGIAPGTPLSFLNGAAVSRAWETGFKGVTSLPFTDATGSKNDYEYLVSDEETMVTSAKASGFVKDYYGGDISFMAFMPTDGSDARSFASELTNHDITELWNSRSGNKTAVNIPAFYTQNDLDHKEELSWCGISDIYDYGRAELGNGAYLDKIFSSTHLDICTQGSGFIPGANIAIVDAASDALTFDHPFIVAIMDNETGCPLMLGLIENICG